MEKRKYKLDIDISMEYLDYIKNHRNYIYSKKAVLDFCIDVMFDVNEGIRNEEERTRINEIDIIKNNLEKNEIDFIRELYTYVTGNNISPIHVLEALITRVNILVKYEEDLRDYVRSFTAISTISSYLRKPGVFEELVKLHESKEEGETSLHCYLYSAIFSMVRYIVQRDLKDFQNISHFFKLELKRLVAVMILQSRMTGNKSMHYVAYESFMHNIRALCHTNGLPDTEVFDKVTSLIGSCAV